MAKRAGELKLLADVVAISVDQPFDLQKIDQLLNGTFTLLRDPDLKVIRAYGMEHQMSGAVVGNMGYVIIDGQGRVKEQVIDPLFGQHAGLIIRSLEALQ